jgi:hypothetical protein
MAGTGSTNPTPGTRVRSSAAALPALALLAGSIALAAGPARAQSFVNFESGHVRPVALSSDGTRSSR